jgi:hypothetical protein
MEKITFIGPGGQLLDAVRGQATGVIPNVGDLVTKDSANMFVKARLWNYDTQVLTIYLSNVPPVGTEPFEEGQRNFSLSDF